MRRTMVDVHVDIWNGQFVGGGVYTPVRSFIVSAFDC